MKKKNVTRLGEVMEKLELSQRDLAHAIGVTPGQISRWINGLNRLPKPAAMAFQTALGVNYEWLLSATGPQLVKDKLKLTAQERKLLIVFKSAPENQKERIISSVKAMVNLIIAMTKTGKTY